MDHAVVVGIVERPGGLGGDAEGVVYRELALPAEPVAERLALDERHGEPEAPRRFARVVDRQDVGMLQAGGEADLALKALGPEGGRELGEEDLEGDGAVVAEVLGQIHDGHAAAAELALERIAIGEGVAQAVRHAHGGSRGPRNELAGTGWGPWLSKPRYRRCASDGAPRWAPRVI
jgi:hypothetical protein